MSFNDASPPAKRVKYSELLRFYFPLSVQPFVFFSLHSMVNGALARLPMPEQNLAALTVVKSLTNTIKAPDLVAQQMTVSLIDDRASLRTVMRFTWSVCGVLFGVLFVLGFTPAGGWTLRNIVGLTDPKQIALAYTVMRITCFVPVAETLRSSMQGMAIGLGKTHAVPVGTGVRFVVITAFLWWAVNTQAPSGDFVGGLSWTLGLSIEGVVLFSYLFKRFGSLNQAADRMPHRNDDALKASDVWRFFAPLGVMMLLSQAVQPLLQSGLARSVSPTLSLAAYGVAWDLLLILTGPIWFLHQCCIVYVKNSDDPNWPVVKRFCVGVGLVIAGLILGSAITPFGNWLVGRVIGVAEPVASTALRTFAAFALYPVIRSWREAHWGLLMRARSTAMIAGAKIISLLVVGILTVGPFGHFGPRYGIAPAVWAALMFTVGEGVETIIIWHSATSQSRQSK